MKFWERMQQVIEQGVETSKDVLSKAKEKAKDLGEKGILKFDIMKLEKHAEKNLLLLGSKVFELIVEKGEVAVKKEDEAIKKIIDEILEIKEKIEEKEEELENI